MQLEKAMELMPNSRDRAIFLLKLKKTLYFLVPKQFTSKEGNFSEIIRNLEEIMDRQTAIEKN